LDYLTWKRKKGSLVGWLADIEGFAPATGEPDFIYERAEWAVPSQASFQYLMRYAFEHPDEVKKKGLAGLEVAKEFTWEKSAKAVLERLNQIETQAS
jgi:hypothetical protein